MTLKTNDSGLCSPRLIVDQPWTLLGWESGRWWTPASLLRRKVCCRYGHFHIHCNGDNPNLKCRRGAGDKMLLLQRRDQASVPRQRELPTKLFEEGRIHRLWGGHMLSPAPGLQAETRTWFKRFILVKDIRVDKVIIHPEYGLSPSGVALNDIMLIKLSQPVEYNEWVRPVCLPDL